MASDYDNQLIESVAARRTRLLTALLYGDNPSERRWMDTFRLFLFSVAVAAAIAAVCVGYSFVSNLLQENREKEQQQQQQQQQQQSPVPSVPVLPPAAGSLPTQAPGA